ncbi:MAG: aminotransferase class V-fold PLP-dependent enzyme [bacterium]|nr:aminotransferase class V-fold PLP-dependent enzyme [bacterium]
MSRTVYLDNAAATRPYKEVVEAMGPYFTEHFGNPMSFHKFGSTPKEAMEEARNAVAGLIGAKPEEIFFTASGTEANNFAIKGVAAALEKKGKHIVTSAIEHYGVHHSCKMLERLGFETTYVPVDENGMVDPDAVGRAIRDDTILVSVMLANHEVGTIQPISRIAEVVREKKITFHSDARMAVGHIPVDVEALGVDLLTISGQHFYGPKGSGALYIRKGVRIQPLIHGGVQEQGRRAGTENVPAIVGFGRAAVLAAANIAGEMERVRGLRDRLEQGLKARIDELKINGHRENRLPGFLNLCANYVEGEAMIMMMIAKGIMAASGSACSSKALKASHVLTALGVDHALAQGSILFSLGRETSAEDVDYVIQEFPPIVERLRMMSPIYNGKAGR